MWLHNVAGESIIHSKHRGCSVLASLLVVFVLFLLDLQLSEYCSKSHSSITLPNSKQQKQIIMFVQFSVLGALSRCSTSSVVRCFGANAAASSKRLLSSSSSRNTTSIFRNFPQLNNRIRSTNFKAPSAAADAIAAPLKSANGNANAGGHGFSSKMGLLFGATLTTGLYMATAPVIKNDSPLIGGSRSPPIGVYHDKPFSPERNLPPQPAKRRLSYEDLTYGSIFGLALGIVIGKLSSVLALISFGTFLSLEFLENRGIIHIPWNGIVKFGTQRVNLKSLVFDNSSFKIAFILSFFIAAYNV